MLGHSSRELGWDGFTIERHEVAAGDKPETTLRQHFVAAWTEPCYGERRNLRGQLAPFCMRPGSVTLLPIGPAPPLRLSSSTEVTVVALQSQFIDSVEGEFEHRSSAPFTDPRTLEEPQLSILMSLLMKECDSGGVNGRVYAESLAHAIAIRFLQLGKEERRRGSLYAHISSPRSIRRVLDRMHAEFDADLTLRELAVESGYSRRHFLRMFEGATGYTPHQYLLQLRIKHAKELIRKTSMPLINVAAYSGFSSQSHMSQIFRRHCGATPAQVRRDLTYSSMRTRVMNNPVIPDFGVDRMPALNLPRRRASAR
jgi:AraC family transcriptional regulator